VTSRARLEDSCRSPTRCVRSAAGGRPGPRGEHAAHRHLELHASCSTAPIRRNPQTKLLEKIRRQTFPRGQDREGLLTLRARRAVGERAAAGGPEHRHQRRAVAARHQFKAVNIPVRRDLAPAPPMVLRAEHKLQQVFLNLSSTRGRDAPGGWLSVTTRAAGEWRTVEVGDTAPHPGGTPLAHLRPFSRRRLGQGTGRPLHHVCIGRRARRDHQLRQPSGGGTRFTLALPLLPAANAPPPRRADARVGPWRAPAPSRHRRRRDHAGDLEALLTPRATTCGSRRTARRAWTWPAPCLRRRHRRVMMPAWTALAVLDELKRSTTTWPS